MIANTNNAVTSEKMNWVSGVIGLWICFGLALPAAAQTTARDRHCMALEQQLARDWSSRSHGRQQLPRLKEEIRKQDRAFQKARFKAERANCYESMFIFGRSLRRTPRCLRLHRKIEKARRRLSQLQAQKEAITRPVDRRGRQDQIISELARRGCGSYYQKEARRRSNRFFFWDSDSIFGDREREEERRGGNTALPFATYRTLCVRLCDGYYYPVSFSTLPSRFNQDASACQSNCAAPAELFIHRNPGEDIEQAVSLTGRPYSELPNAWRYRKEFVKGCSCKLAEYKSQDERQELQQKQDRSQNQERPRDQEKDETPKKKPSKKVETQAQIRNNNKINQ